MFVKYSGECFLAFFFCFLSNDLNYVHYLPSNSLSPDNYIIHYISFFRSIFFPSLHPLKLLYVNLLNFIYVYSSIDL